MSQDGKPWSPTYAWMKLMIADDAVKARKRMRNAWIAGFVSAGIGFYVSFTSSPGTTSAGDELLSTSEFAFLLIESSLMAVLAYGVLRRVRAAAVLLFFYFLISRIPLLAIGVMKPEVLPLQLLFGYLFFQGMRGALTFHYLTHPHYLTPPLPQEREASTDYVP